MAEEEMSYEQLRERILARSPKAATLLVGIDGPGGSGKSTLARALAATGGYPLVQVDDFYRPSAERYAGPAEMRPVGANFDLPRLEAQVLRPLREGRPTAYHRYDWEHDRLGERVELDPGGIVIIEGIYCTSGSLTGSFDYRVWVECPYDERLRRGLERDGEQARDTWVNDWMPQEDLYVQREDPARRADLVVFGGDRRGNDPLRSVGVLTEGRRSS